MPPLREESQRRALELPARGARRAAAALPRPGAGAVRGQLRDVAPRHSAPAQGTRRGWGWGQGPVCAGRSGESWVPLAADHGGGLIKAAVEVSLLVFCPITQPGVGAQPCSESSLA